MSADSTFTGLCESCDPRRYFGAASKQKDSTMPTGTVKFFNDEKGYGFIQRADGEPDVFVHFSNIEGTGRRTLMAGQQVEFELGQGRKGVEAHNVRAIA